MTLFAAGTLSVSTLWAETIEREQISVSDQDELREALSVPVGTDDKDVPIYRNNADVTLTGNIDVTTTRTADIKDSDGNVTGTATYADNTIEVLADNVKLRGEGHEISSSEIDLDVNGSGDLFFLDGVKLSVENITFAGTTDATKKTGRVFLLGNAVHSILDIGAGTVFENRRLVADEYTNYRARGGALVSARILDEVTLESSASEDGSGDIVFRGNLAHGKVLSSTNSDGETVTETLDAAGGAVFASGLLSVSGAGTTLFENNSAISDAGTAFGGAIFVVNASLNKDGSLSDSSIYPDSVTDLTGKKKFGLQVTETTLTFSGNSAEGANAQGGAIAVSGGYFDAAKAEVSFTGNVAKNTAVGGKVFGGAFRLDEGAKATFDAETKLSFSQNRAEAGAEQATVVGGALAVSDATLSLAGTTTFSGNSATSALGGSALSGGALYISGTLESVKNPDGTTTKEHTTNVTLAGSLNFSQNEVSATALSSEKITGTDENPETEIIESSAQGGAIAFFGGKIVSGENLTSLVFSGNSVSAKTFAQGGALASLSDKTELVLTTPSEIKFEKNSAKILALESGEAQTDGVVPVAQGGAIFQQAGKLTLGASDFSGNKAVSRIAQGGAIYAAGGEQNFAETTFTQNQALAGTDASAPGTTFARGGAIFAESSATLNFSGATEFSLNSAYARSATGADASGKRSGAAGGAIYSAGTLNFDEVSFINSSAVVSGDANGAAFGGAVYVAGGKFSANTFTARKVFAVASGNAQGGAVYADSAGIFDVSGEFTVSGSVARGVSGTDPKNASGGAIYAAGTLRSGGDFSVTGNSVSGEKASGGAIAVASGNVVISGTETHEISSNKATSSAGDALGGAISVNGGTFRQTAGTLTLSGNTATATGGNALGGAIYMRGGNVTLTNADISGNSATGGNALGGAIYIDSSRAGTLTLSGNTKLAGNTAGGVSDGIYVGAGTGAVEIIFDTNATLTENEDGSVTRSNIETATISDKITADGATVSLTKSGAGDLTLGEISALNDAKISMNFNGGVSTLGGEVASLEKLSVASGAEVSLEKTLGGYKSAEIAGTVNVGSGATWTFANGAETKLSGTLAFDGASADVLGASSISGKGTFSVKNATTLKFADASASLSAQTLSIGAGTLTLDGAGTLNVTEKLIFTETGAEIALNGATLGIVEVARTVKDDHFSAKISGTGTLVLYTEANAENPPKNFDFSEFSEKVKDETTGEETTTVYKGAFEIGSGISVKAGVSVSNGVSVKLSQSSLVAGSKNVLLNGGTLLTDAGATLELETLTISGDAVSTLGVAGENQSFKMVESDTGKTDGNGNPIPETEALSLTGKLDITETTTFVGAVILGKSGALSGAGKVEGNVSGAGSVSVAEIDGNLNVANGNTMTVAESVAVTGNVGIYSDRTTGTTANAQLRLTQGASLSAAKFNNFGVVSAESATLSGNFVNAGTLSVAKDSTLTFAEGSEFSNGYSDVTETLAGTLDLSAANSAIDFSAIVDESNIELKNGVVRINSVNLQKGEALPILGIDDKTIFDGLKIEDVNSYSLENRFVWDASAGELIFLGLNGERFRGTLYGDLQRESINATYDFMRAAQFRNGTRILTPELYGAYKLQSPYMRGYIEKVRQRGGEVSAQLEAKRKRELEMAEKLNSRLVNFWAQADFSDGNQRSRKGFDGYDSMRMNILVGASMPLKNWELGLALSGGDENYEMDSAGTRHEVDTTATGLTGYAQYKNDWFDCTFGAAGMMTSSDTDRGEYSGDFNGWRAGAMTELGVTLRAQSWFALRTFVGLSAAYAHSGSFSESGGEGALSVDSDGAASVRTTVGTSAAFLLTDTLQLKVHAAWLVDFGNDTCSLDAYMPSTRTDYVIDSRENESSLLEAGATLNWAFSENMEVFLGYTGTIGAGERVNAASLGLNYFF